MRFFCFFFFFVPALFFISTGIDALIVPDEVPTLLSLIYSNIPTLKKGTDSRLGWGFRLGNRADFQVLVELGPQKETQPLANQEDKSNNNKRSVLSYPPFSPPSSSSLTNLQNTDNGKPTQNQQPVQQPENNEQNLKKGEENFLEAWRQMMSNKQNLQQQIEQLKQIQQQQKQQLKQIQQQQKQQLKQIQQQQKQQQEEQKQKLQDERKVLSGPVILGPGEIDAKSVIPPDEDDVQDNDDAAIVNIAKAKKKRTQKDEEEGPLDDVNLD